MVRKIGYLILGMALTGVLHAQQAPRTPNEQEMYCGGVVSSAPAPTETYVISGVESDNRLTFEQGHLVFLNQGSDHGVRVGAEFLVSRPVSEPLRAKWFTWQDDLMRAMGTTYADIGRVRVVNVQMHTSTAEIVYSCDMMQRGDIAQTFAPRPAPPYKPEGKLDLFAAPSGKGQAMVVTMRGFGVMAGTGTVVYVNLGGAQGVKVGDYFRVYRYQGQRHTAAYQARGTAYMIPGMGHTPVPYGWADLPRDVLGEGIVLRVGPNASTVLITYSLREIYTGDYVEVE
jgi:hypothetical protein